MLSILLQTCVVFGFLMITHNCIIGPTRAKLGNVAGHSCSYSNEGGIGDKGHYLGISGRNMYHNVEGWLLTLCSCWD